MADHAVDPASLPNPPADNYAEVPPMPDWAPVIEKHNQAAEPVEFRIQRAFLNGYAEGLHRGVQGRLDRG